MIKEAVVDLLFREAPIYLAASIIAYFMTSLFPLPLGEEASSTAFSVVGGFCGVWFGRRRWVRRSIPVLAFGFFCVTGTGYLLMRYFLPDPPYPVILIEIVILGCASFCFFWAVTGAGFQLSKSRPSG
jgi:hypothetical protein